MNIFYVDAPCGAGKTTKLIEVIKNRYLTTNVRVVIAQPTKILLDETSNRLNEAGIVHSLIHSSESDNPTDEYQKALLDADTKVILATQATVLNMNFAKAGTVHLYVDEVPTADESINYNLSRNKHKLLEDFCFVPFADQELMTVEVNPNSSNFTNIIRHKGDTINKSISRLYEVVKSPNYDVVINRSVYERLIGTNDKFQFVANAILKPEVVSSWDRVTIMGANVKAKMLYHFWTNYGVEFKEDPFFKNLSREHTNGDRLTIGYMFDDLFSVSLINKFKDAGINLFRDIANVAEGVFGSQYLLSLNVNESIVSPKDRMAFKNGVLLPVIAHGLNDYSHFTNAVFMTALNDNPSHMALIRDTMGVQPTEVYIGKGADIAYQFLCRTDIRNAVSTSACHWIVPDRRTADFLAGKFLGASVYKVAHDIALPEKAAKPEAKTNAENLKKSREITKIEKALISDIAAKHLLHFGIGANVYDKAPVPQSMTAKGLFRLLDKAHTSKPTSKATNGYITPSVSRDDASRQNPNILAIDIDGTTIAPQDALEAIPYAAGIYNTFSCHHAATGLYRYRIYIPMTHEVPNAFGRWIANRIIKPLAAIDANIDIDKTSSKDVYYLPCKPASGNKVDYFRHINLAAPTLNPMDFTRAWAKEEHSKAVEDATKPITAPKAQGKQNWQAKIREQINLECVQKGLELYADKTKGKGDKNFNLFAYYLMKNSTLSTMDFQSVMTTYAGMFGSSEKDRLSRVPTFVAEYRQKHADRG
ncbi:hypothetical protein [Agrobacterium pusense]|uniref:hypothetical protein n=1 Tax=Agrobacterium pusense TaxID=648995 RepID=UPI0022B86AB8|nr:hypothetical protein [Agrobacterium pusense]MCZ7926197.1 hypothetical protein [Agrobacterium pusense]